LCGFFHSIVKESIVARNGSGTYSRVAGTPYVNNTTISETVVNSEMDDIASALTASIAKDGQTTPTANLPMATYRHTGVGQASALTDYARYDQVQNSSAQWLSGVSGSDTITASATPTPGAYYAGQTFRFVAAGANTGAPTLNISGLGAKSIVKDGTTVLVAGDIPSGSVVEVVFDGTNFQLLSKADPMRIKSIQRAVVAITISGGSGNNTATITSIDTTKSIIEVVGVTSASLGTLQAYAVLTNATTVTVYASTNVATSPGNVEFQVVEYY
jgi:hypothetical protein